MHVIIAWLCCGSHELSLADVPKDGDELHKFKLSNCCALDGPLKLKEK